VLASGAIFGQYNMMWLIMQMYEQIIDRLLSLGHMLDLVILRIGPRLMDLANFVKSSYLDYVC
jgi:hypothetical protein